MHRLLAVAAAMIVAGCVPALAEAAPLAATPQAALMLAAPTTAGPTAILTSTKKKKKKKKSSSSSSNESATLNDIASAKRGKKDVEVTAKTGKADRECELKIKYADGTTDSPDSETSNSDKVCTFKIDIPDEKGVVGDAKAELTVKDSKGKKVASDSRTFSVK